RSEPVTAAPARAARTATPPVPVPTSSQRSSRLGSSSATRWSWMSAARAATRSNGADPQTTLCRCLSSSNAMTRYLRVGSLFGLRAIGQLIPCTPQRREEVVMDHLAENFDRRSLRADDLVADHACDDLVVP